MASTRERIRAAVAELEAADQGRRVPERLRRRVAKYAQSRLAEGDTIEGVARDVGVSWTSVRRWLEAYAESAVTGFGQVEIVEDDEGDEGARLIVRGPAGLVIEGLDIHQLAELLRRLG